MLVQALPDTYLTLSVEHEGVEYSVTPTRGLAYVPSVPGGLLEKARLAKVIDADAEPPWLDGDDKWAAWVTPAWPPTRHRKGKWWLA
jgi:hypothetical protein